MGDWGFPIWSALIWIGVLLLLILIKLGDIVELMEAVR